MLILRIAAGVLAAFAFLTGRFWVLLLALGVLLASYLRPQLLAPITSRIDVVTNGLGPTPDIGAGFRPSSASGAGGTGSNGGSCGCS
jgi:hypothetical protein